MLLAIPPLSLMPILPAFYFFDRLADIAGSLSSISYLYLTPIVAWPTAMALIAFTVLLIAAIRWIVLPKVRPGSTPSTPPSTGACGSSACARP